ncbi:peptidoglycan-binding protein [Devosia sp. A449]
MARAHPIQDMSELASEPQPGEWHALRGELVALLDQVEGRYARVERPEPALTGLSRRVRNLRDQVERPEPAVRRREALRTVKRAVDRFSERDELEHHLDQQDELTSAIAEIRGRQLSAPAAALGRRATDLPEFRELSALVGGLSGRLERLEGELKSQRASNGSVREVADQVEQLTHVVELLAGAVGETGQVKRLEAQIGALAALIESGPRVDLSAINGRLDDVSATVGKLAELQAQQMEREIAREDRSAEAAMNTGAALEPAMHAIETSVRNVYDRIDSIEKNVTLSAGDFERLTSEMAAFTQAMKNSETAPAKLVAKVEALASQIGGLDTANGDVAGLKQDIAALRDAVMAGMEPRFLRIESQLEALSDRMAPGGDTAQVESQLKLLMARMDETGVQLNGLAKLYANPSDPAEMEAIATLVAERTSDALTRKAPAPVAMFGPDSLKSIEDRITGLIKSAGKTPDYETLAALVAERTSEAFARANPAGADSGFSEASMTALEKRMAALFNTAGKDTAERLTRLEAALGERQDRAAAPVATPAPARSDAADGEQSRIDAMLSALASPQPAKSDLMPANPGDDAPLVDPGFKNAGPVRSALDAKAATRPSTSAPEASPRPAFDPASVERPARPQSSFAQSDADPFAPTAAAQATAPQVDLPLGQNSTSTFVAAARRAQRARQEAEPATVSSNSLISRALARVMPSPTPAEPVTGEAAAPKKAEKPAKPVKEKKVQKAEEPVAAPALGRDTDSAALADQPSFLTRHRRPLLLAATLVAVSMLALNLVIQRMGAVPQPAPPPIDTGIEMPSATPSATDDVSLVLPEPRVIDMVDDTATASISPRQTMSFTVPVATTPMPASLLALSANDAVDDVPTDIAPDVTGSISAVAAVETFELPVEGAGPLELRQAAADGDARAQFEVAAIYTEGRAVTQDYAEAAKWYERSAAQGFVPAQYRLGNLYEAGQGVEKDLEIAKLWYQRGAEAGNRMAMHNLAALYAGGLLGEQEFETAAEWFAQAAARGMTDSQFNLGMLYARGLGVEQDFEQSYKWFSLAADNGDADAGKARDDIAKSLSAEAVSRVTGELAGWTAEPIDLAANFAPIGTWSSSFDPGQSISTRDVVSKVQLALGKLGFDVGVPDGLAGPKTAEAIKAFERGAGMSESGAINPRLLAVLGSQPV